MVKTVQLGRRAEEIPRWIIGADVLDVGCVSQNLDPDSEWWLHSRILEVWPNAWGLDKSKEGIERLRSLGFSNLIEGDAQDFQLNYKFDTIVAGDIIEHLGNPLSFLSRAKVHLRPQGRLVITTPYPFSLWNFLYAAVKYPKTCASPFHTAWFCPETIDCLARQAGLRLVTWKLIEDYPQDVGSWGYRLFLRIISSFRRAIPDRFRCNTILVVIVHDDGEIDD